MFLSTIYHTAGTDEFELTTGGLKFQGAHNYCLRLLRMAIGHLFVLTHHQLLLGTDLRSCCVSFFFDISHVVQANTFVVNLIACVVFW